MGGLSIIALCFVPWVAIPQFFNKTLKRDVRLVESPRNCALVLLVIAWALAIAVAAFTLVSQTPNTPDVGHSGVLYLLGLVVFVLPLLPTVLVLVWVLIGNEIRARASYHPDDNQPA